MVGPGLVSELLGSSRTQQASKQAINQASKQWTELMHCSLPLLAELNGLSKQLIVVHALFAYRSSDSTNSWARGGMEGQKRDSAGRYDHST